MILNLGKYMEHVVGEAANAGAFNVQRGPTLFETLMTNCT